MDCVLLLYCFNVFVYPIPNEKIENSLVYSVSDKICSDIFIQILHNFVISSLKVQIVIYSVKTGVNFMVFILIFMENCLLYDAIRDF